ncbi:pilus assembly protein CpaB [Rhodovulum iodosum]|uniref:Pilus assembly protein CpaB n=1 Tax=Rhodovulum iodosum TaxID=68291 RepID=A0ABV3XWM6_9RHOB|nr:Flp pilus assembly protein CpaB [Rhodovulum robiginosum]RSK34199.1 Flp pilus assembly protein CpaB [Rhodovulum robiginosum]
MRFRSLLMMLIGIAIAGGSVFFAQDFLSDTQSNTASAKVEPDLVDIVVARAPISYGMAIESHLVTTQKWPKEAVPPGAHTSYAAVLPQGSGAPRRAKYTMAPGEVLLDSKLSGFGEKVTIVQKLGANSRAMALKVDAVSGVGGFVTPGDRVDIVLTQGRGSDMSAVTVLQNILVIGVDQQADQNTDQPSVARTVTVEVAPDQSQILALAQKAGSLSLTLRTLDSDGEEDKPLDKVKLRDLLREKSPIPQDERGPTIIIRRGTTAEVVDVN